MDAVLSVMAGVGYFAGVGLTTGLIMRWWPEEDSGAMFWFSVFVWPAILPGVLAYRLVKR